MPVQPSPDTAGRYSSSAAGRMIGVTHPTIIEWCDRGLLPGAVQLPSGRWRIPLRAIAHLIPADLDAA